MIFNKKAGGIIFIVCVAMITMYTFVLPAQAAPIDTRYARSYVGTYLGDVDFGTIDLTISANGDVAGVGKSSVLKIDIPYSGMCQSDGTLQFTADNGRYKFAGRIDWMSRIFGKWTHSEDCSGGSFTAVPSDW